MPDENQPIIALEDVVVKEPTQLSDTEKTFLTEHKDELTTAEAQRFGIQVETKVEPEVRNLPKPPEKKEKEDDEEGQPEDVDAINKVVDKRMAPLEQQAKEQQDIIDLNNLIIAKPEYSVYREQIKAYQKSEAYKHIPVDNIAIIVASRDLQKIGARKEREAQKKVAASKNTGVTVRTPEGKPVDWHNVSKEDYQAQRARVLGHQG